MCTFIDMDDKEIINFLNESQALVLESFPVKYISKTLLNNILEKSDFQELLQRWKVDSVERLLHILHEVCKNEVPSDVRKDFLLKEIVPKMMALENEVHIRDNLVEVAFMLCPLVPITELSTKEYELFLKEIYSKYIPAISQLRDSNYANWHQLWIYLVKFCAKKIHDSMDLTNRLLRIVEYAFRNSSCEQRLRGYDCWKELIDNASLDQNHMCSQKQIKLLMTPLRAKFSKQDVVICKRFDVFVYLLQKLKKQAILCLPEFLEFCFGPVGDCKDNSRLGQAKSVPQIWTKSASVLVAVLGHSHDDTVDCISEVIRFDKPIVVGTNFKIFCKVVINSVAECCNLLKDDNLQYKRDKVIKCLWKSLFNLIIPSSELDRSIYVAVVTPILDNYIKHYREIPYYEEMLKIIFISLISVDSDLKPEFIPMVLKQMVTIFMITDIGFHNINRDFKQVITNSFSKVILEENKTQMIQTIMNCLLDETFEDKALPNFTKMWILLANEISVDCSSSNLAKFPNFDEFFMWPAHNLHRLIEAYKKQMVLQWMKLYRKVTLELESKKFDIMKDLERTFKNNPLLSSNIASLLNVMSQFETKFTKEFVIKLLSVASLVLQLPNLNLEDENKLSSLVIQYFESSLECYSSDDIDELIKTICLCIEHMLCIHAEFKLIDPLANFIKSASQDLKNNLSKYLKQLLTNLYQKETDSSSYKAKELFKILSLLDEGEKTTEEAKRTFVIPSGRSARIAHMGKNSPTSPHKPTKPSTSLRLFGKDLDTMSPLKVKGSQLHNISTPTKKKGANVIEIKDRTTKSVNEENSLDFIAIDTEVNLQVDKLNEHQKEILRKRREDIPALYQDLSQSMSQDIFSSKSNSKEPIQKEIETKVTMESTIETCNSNRDLFSQISKELPLPDIISQTTESGVTNSDENIQEKNKDSCSRDFYTDPLTKLDEPISSDMFSTNEIIEKGSSNTQAVIITNKIKESDMNQTTEALPSEQFPNYLTFSSTKVGDNIGRESPAFPTIDDEDLLAKKKRREIERLRMDIVGADTFYASPKRTRVKKAPKPGENSEKQARKDKNKSEKDEPVDTQDSQTKEASDNQIKEQITADLEAKDEKMNTDRQKNVTVPIKSLMDTEIIIANEKSLLVPKPPKQVRAKTKERKSVEQKAHEISTFLEENRSKKTKEKRVLPESQNKSIGKRKKEKTSNLGDKRGNEISQDVAHCINTSDLKNGINNQEEKTSVPESPRRGRPKKVLQKAPPQNIELANISSELPHIETAVNPKELDTISKHNESVNSTGEETVTTETPKKRRGRPKRHRKTVDPDNSKIALVTAPLETPKLVGMCDVEPSPHNDITSSRKRFKGKISADSQKLTPKNRAAKIIEKLESPTDSERKSKRMLDRKNEKSESPEKIAGETPKNIKPGKFNRKKILLQDLSSQNSTIVDSQEIGPENKKKGEKRKATDDNEDIIESSQESFTEILPILNSSKKRNSSKIDDSKIVPELKEKEDNTNVPIQHEENDTQIIRGYALELPDKIELISEETDLINLEERQKDGTTSQDTTITQDNSLSSDDTLSRVSALETLSHISKIGDNEVPVQSPESPKKPLLTESELAMCQMDTMSICATKDTIVSEDNVGALKSKEENNLDILTTINSIGDILATPSTETASPTYLTTPGTPNRSQHIPSSPITADTPNRTHEFLDDTMNISPITSRHNSEEEILSDIVPVVKQIEINFGELEKLGKAADVDVEDTEIHGLAAETGGQTSEIEGHSAKTNEHSEEIELEAAEIPDKSEEIGQPEKDPRDLEVHEEKDDTFEDGSSSNDSEPIDASNEAEISSIENENKHIACEPDLNDEPIKNGEVSTIVNTISNRNIKDSTPDRSSKLQNFIHSISNKPLIKRKGGNTSSPSTVRIKKLFVNLGSKQFSQELEENCAEDLNENDILTFSREIPSPFAVPRSSILKRKFSDSSDGEGISPCAKRKRVNFSDPCLTSKKIFIIDDYQPSVEAKRLFDTSSDPKSIDEHMADFFDFSDEPPSSELSAETDSEPIETEPSLTVVNPMVLQKSKPIFSKLVDCTDDVLVIVKRITSPMFVPAIMNKLKGKNIKTIGDLARLSESEVNRFPFKVPVVANVIKALENYHRKKGGTDLRHEERAVNCRDDEKRNGEMELPKLDIKSEQKMLIKRAQREKVPVEELGKILLPHIDHSKLCLILKSHCPSIALDTIDEKDYTSVLKIIVDSKGISEILKRAHVNFYSEEREHDFYQALADYVKYTVPLEKFFNGRSIVDLEVGIEESIKNNVFQKNDVIEHCLLPLIETPKDISSYLDRLTDVVFDEIVISRLKMQDAQSFFARILKSCSPEESKKISESLWCNQPSTSRDMFACFEKKLETQTDQERTKMLIEMIKFASEKLDIENLAEIHIGFVRRISGALENKQ